MKILIPLFTASVLVLASGCSIFHHDSKSQAASGKPQGAAETVLITYYPAAGREQEFEAALAHAWQVYQKDHLAYDEPHTVVRGNYEGGKWYYVEIFTWKKAPLHLPADVNAVWSQEQALCEAKGGHKGIEGGPVEMALEK